MGGNTTGASNTVVGWFALASNIVGLSNTAVGRNALQANIGNFNNAYGSVRSIVRSPARKTAPSLSARSVPRPQAAPTPPPVALRCLTAPLATTTPPRASCRFQFNQRSGNVYIGRGWRACPAKTTGCYIRSISAKHVPMNPVLINSANKLGTINASKRFKEDIKPMERASEALLALKPHTFRYKKDIDPAGKSHSGL